LHTVTSPLDQRLQAELAKLRAADLYRVRRAVSGGHGAAIVVDGRACVNFCSNDYLGLAADPRVARAAQAALERSGTGSGAAALVSGYNAEHRALEEELADFLGLPRALLFATGWAANIGVLRALLGRDDILIADELNHASLIDGGRLSGAHYLRVAHRDLEGFERALAAWAPDAEHSPPTPHESGRGTRGAVSAAAALSAQQVLLATDSVFSMDGDIADVPALLEMTRRHGAALMVDDAHGFGVLGPHGRGILEHFGFDGGTGVPSAAAAMSGAIAADGSRVPDPQPRTPGSASPDPRRSKGGSPVPDVYVATLGKSLGAAGAFVAGSDSLIEYLIQRARSWVFSTAPPPAIAAAARAALRIVRDEPERRARLHENIARFRKGLDELDLPFSPAAPDPAAAKLCAPTARVANSECRSPASATPIQPLILGEAARALEVSRRLYERGYWVAAIRPPTVPRGTSRLRITLSAAHTPQQIDGLLSALHEACAAVAMAE
jgi:8-amino-7-oxononanoate synthase